MGAVCCCGSAVAAEGHEGEVTAGRDDAGMFAGVAQPLHPPKGVAWRGEFVTKGRQLETLSPRGMLAGRIVGDGQQGDRGRHRIDACLLFNYTGQQASLLTSFTYCNYLVLEFH